MSENTGERKAIDIDIAGALGVCTEVPKQVQKAENAGQTLKRLLKYMKPQAAALIAMALLAAIGAWFAIWVPDILKKVTDSLVESIQFFKSVDLPYISSIIWTCAALYFLNALFQFASGLIGASMSQNAVRRMRNDVKAKLDKVALAYFDQTPVGDIMSRVTNDIEIVAITLQESIIQVITAVMTVIGVFIMMMRLDVMLALISLISVPLLFFTSSMIVKKSQREFASMQFYIGRLNGHIEEMYAGHNIIELFGREKDSIEDYEVINEELRKATKKAQFLASIILPSIKFINNLAYVAVCVIGGIRAGRGLITIGDIQAFIQYTRQFAQPIEQVSNIANTIQSALAAAERVFQVFDLEEMEEDRETPVDINTIRGEVEFKNVRFGYCPDRVLITNLNLKVKAGDSIAIVGPTGAGKTTLVNLLMRFYELNSGEITIDGINIKDFSRHDLRTLYGMVLQDTWLFNGTVADNIAYGRKGASREEIIEAAKKAYAHQFIETMENGYDTVLNEDATNISQGQKQLLTIARAILKDPKIIILDEATSSVDTRTEEYIQSAMLAMMEGKTSFVIAHRLSTIKSAKVILVMNNGNVIEQGNHESLMEQQGFYYDLYNSQFAGVAEEEVQINCNQS
jgi:ATP-binding cassette subfamily B multidrug efflux pump